MTEEVLIELGFEKINIDNVDSQNGYDYYFYQKELCDNLILCSIDSLEVKDDNWELVCWEIPAIKIKTKDHYLDFVDILNNIIC